MVSTTLRTDAPSLHAVPPPDEERPDFSRYSHPVDRGVAGAENTPGGVTYVPLILHASYSPGRRITRAQRTEALIKQAAVRIVAGLEERSLRELAEEIGCCHQAIDNIVKRFCVRLGLRPVRISEATRAKQRAARRRQIDSKN